MAILPARCHKVDRVHLSWRSHLCWIYRTVFFHSHDVLFLLVVQFESSHLSFLFFVRVESESVVSLYEFNGKVPSKINDPNHKSATSTGLLQSKFKLSTKNGIEKLKTRNGKKFYCKLKPCNLCTLSLKVNVSFL